jgi:hypothetical protein
MPTDLRSVATRPPTTAPPTSSGAHPAAADTTPTSANARIALFMLLPRFRIM